NAMKVVCEFSGVTSLDVKEEGKLKVTRAFNNFEMTKKLRKVCKHVEIIAVGPNTEPKQNRHPVKWNVCLFFSFVPHPPIPVLPRAPRVRGENSDLCIIM
ncbi:hypothetical protein EUTSA_v10016007mg, partial [Eutrema salsugineum]